MWLIYFHITGFVNKQIVELTEYSKVFDELSEYSQRIMVCCWFWLEEWLDLTSPKWKWDGIRLRETISNFPQREIVIIFYTDLQIFNIIFGFTELRSITFLYFPGQVI